MLQKINIKFAIATLLALVLIPGIEIPQLSWQVGAWVHWTQEAAAKSNEERSRDRSLFQENSNSSTSGIASSRVPVSSQLFHADEGDTFAPSPRRRYSLSRGNGMFAMCLGLGSASLIMLLVIAKGLQSSDGYSNRGGNGAIAYRQNMRDS